MSATQIRFLTLWRRELNRFMKIKKQTIGAPLLETFLYISVFGAALGTRIDTLEGFDYVVFVIPGLGSMTTAPMIRAENCTPVTVSTGIAALRSPCRASARIGDRPLARAVRR